MGTVRLNILKVSAVAVLALFIAWILHEKDPKQLTEDEMSAGMEALMPEGCSLSTDMRFKRAYSLNSRDYEYVVYYEPSTNMDVSEMLIVCLKDESQRPEVEKAIDGRLATQKKNFDGYGTDQFDILGRARTFTSGKYICFFVADDPAAILDGFKKLVEV